MIGETFRVHEIDDYGGPWAMKEWPGKTPDSVRLHDIASDAEECSLLNR